MECHDVQQLLAFVNRQAEGLDAAERAAIRAHLEQCPDCAALAQADLRADEALAAMMRAVPVPAGLKQQVLNRLAAERGAARWRGVKRGALVAAAAALLIAVAGGLAWYGRLPAEVNQSDADAVVIMAVIRNRNWDEDAAKDHLKAQGLSDIVPPQFDYQTLQSVEAIEFKGRRVAKLTFAKGADFASVLVLPFDQFCIHKDLEDDPTCRKIVPDPESRVYFLILFQGNLGTLQPPPILS